MILTGFWKFSICKTFVTVLAFAIPILSIAQDDKPVLIDESGGTLETLSENATLFEQQSELDPQLSSIYSAVLPGLGQAYNGHHWKIPIIYAGGLAFFQIVRKNHKLYQTFRNALFAEIDLDENTQSPFGDGFSVDALRRNTDAFRRDRDFFIIMGILWYGLNIVDAHVSAHLDEFNVNDELSFNLSPTLLSVPSSPVVFGLALTFNIDG